MMAWCKARTVKDYLVRSKTTNSDTVDSKSAQCSGERCQVCQYVQDTCEFEDADGNKYNISKGVMNCSADFTVYEFHCSSCSKQYEESNITDFRYRFNNYKSAFRKLFKSGKPPTVNQEHFHQHFNLLEHNDKDG